MTSSDLWDAETAENYEETSAQMYEPEVLDPTVDFLALLAGAGPVLEFAIGTGRVAVPLSRRGVPVTGIELSEPMVAQLRRRVGEDDLPVVIGDMASAQVPGVFSLVYLVWNSIANLRTQEEQVECFRNAARHLGPGGRFLVELWVPPLRRLPPGQLAAPFDVSDGHLGAAAEPRPSASPGGAPFKPTSTALAAPAVTFSQTEAGCAAIVKAARAAVAKGVKSTYPATCTAVSLATSTSTASATPATPSCTGVTSGQYVATDRRNACGKTTVQWTVITVPDGILRGVGYIDGQITMESQTGFAQWITNSGWTLDTGRTWGWATRSGVAGKLVGCNPSAGSTCYAGSNWSTTVPAQAWNGVGNYQWIGNPGTSANMVGSGWNLTISGPQMGNPVTILVDLAQNRCDTIITNPATSGCVFSSVPGVLSFSQTRNPQFVWEIYQAQLSGLPGRLSVSPLHRLMNASLQAANNMTACPTGANSPIRPTPIGFQCDEYPFGSSYEGASTTSHPGIARNPVPSQCQMPDPYISGSPGGFSRCYIPSGQNSSSGGLTGAFYGSERILDDDAFFIGYLP